MAGSMTYNLQVLIGMNNHQNLLRLVEFFLAPRRGVATHGVPDPKVDLSACIRSSSLGELSKKYRGGTRWSRRL